MQASTTRIRLERFMERDNFHYKDLIGKQLLYLEDDDDDNEFIYGTVYVKNNQYYVTWDDMKVEEHITQMYLENLVGNCYVQDREE